MVLSNVNPHNNLRNIGHIVLQRKPFAFVIFSSSEKMHLTHPNNPKLSQMPDFL